MIFLFSHHYPISVHSFEFLSFPELFANHAGPRVLESKGSFRE